MDIDRLRTWIGREAHDRDLVTPRLVAEYRATFEPNLFDTGADAPLGLHWCLSPAIAPLDALGPDGHPERGGFLPPVPLPRRMWAGGEIETRAPLRPGDAVTRTSTIADVVPKRGRTGPLCFVAVRHAYATDRGLSIVERHDIVYREAASTAAAMPAPAAAQAAPGPAHLVWTVEASPVLLFRYSAMTFNGHRIHYDHPYVTAVEGYAGLVVHGPIQATLCFNMAAALLGGVPARFRYRNLSPLTAGGVFAVKGARRPDGSVACWTESPDGRICLDGEGT